MFGLALVDYRFPTGGEAVAQDGLLSTAHSVLGEGEKTNKRGRKGTQGA